MRFNMDQDELLEKIDHEGLTPELEEEVADQADDLIERFDELDSEVLDVVVDNL
ncbi:MAG: hypothetical protein GF381_02985 [Candidatus Pacebacteria bacterium]|nr:hypothetical protein [Candidatus Paceibacterota bacterium]